MKAYILTLTVLDGDPKSTATQIRDCCDIATELHDLYDFTVTRIEVQARDDPTDHAIWEHSPEGV